MDAVKVAIRVRPLINRESGSSILWTFDTHQIKSKDGKTYNFDRVFDMDENTEDVYEEIAQPVVETAMEGFNGTIFAYGQTSSGKTYTMMGTEKDPGIIPRSVTEVFKYIQKTPNREFLLRISFMEIYNDVVRDLLVPENTPLKLREDESRNIVVVGLTEEIVHSVSEVLKIIQRGEERRMVGCTNMNEKSSRSHTIFRMIIESRERQNNRQSQDVGDIDLAVMVSQLNMVDLAGSERISQTGAEGKRMKEGCHINKSLFVLGQVINMISKMSEAINSTGSGSQIHINYRDSKLTRILQPALGGNSLTAIICAMTPAVIDESDSTLRFASSAKRIKNKPKVNSVLTDEAQLIRQRKEIRELKQKVEELQQQSSNSQQNTAIMEELETMKRERENQINRLQKLILVSSQPADQPKKRKLRRETWCGRKVLGAESQISLNIPFLDSTMSNTSILEESNLSFHHLKRPLSSTHLDIFATAKKICPTASEVPQIEVEDETIKLREQVKDLENRLKMSEGYHATLEAELNDAKEKSAEDQKVIEEKKSRILQLEDCISMLRDNWEGESKAEDEKEALALEVRKLKRELVEMQNKFESMSDSHANAIIEDLNTQLRESLHSNRINQDKIDDAYNAIDEKENEKEMCEKKIAEMTQEIDQLKSLMSEYENHECPATVVASGPGDKTLALNDAITLSDELLKYKEECDGKIFELKGENEKIQAINKQLESEIEELKDQIEFIKLERDFAHEQQVENKRLSQVLQAREDEIAKLKTPIPDSKEEVIHTENDGHISDLHKFAEEAQNKALAADKELSETKLQLVQSKAQSVKYEKELEKLNLTIQDLNKKLKEFETSMFNAEGEMKSPKEVMEGICFLKTDSEDAQHLLQEANSNLAIASTRIHDLETEIEEKVKLLTRLECDLESMASMQDITKEKYESRIDQLNHQLQEIYKQSEPVHQATTDTEYLENLRKDADLKDKEITELKQELENTRLIVSRLQEEEEKLINATQDMKKLEMELKSLKSMRENQDEVQILNLQIAELQNEVTRLQEQSSQEQSKVPALEKGELDSLQSEMQQKDSDLSGLNNKIKDFENANENLQNELCEKNARISQLVERVKQIETAEQQMKQELQNSQELFDELSIAHKTLQESNANLQIHVRQYENEMSFVEGGKDLREELCITRKELMEMRAINEKLTTKSQHDQGALLAESNRDLDQKRLLEISEKARKDSYATFSDERTAANKEIESLEQKVTDLKTQLCKANCDRDIALRQKNKLTEDCNRLYEQVKELENIHNDQQSCVVPRQIAMDPDKLMVKIKQLTLNLELTKQTQTKSVQENKRLQDQNKKLEAECYEAMNLKAKVADLQSNVNLANSKQEQQSEQLKKKSAEAAELRNKIKELIEHRNKLQSDLDIKTQQSSKNDEEFKETQLTLEKDKHAFEEQLHHLQEKIKQYKQDVEEKERSCEKLIAKLGEMEADAEKSKHLQTELHKKVEHYQSQLEESTRKGESGQNVIDDYKLKLAELETEFGEFKSQVDVTHENLQKEILQSSSKLHESENEKEEVTKMAEMLTLRNDDLQQKIEALEEGKEALNKQFDLFKSASEEEVTQLQKQKSELVDEVTNMKKCIDDLKSGQVGSNEAITASQEKITQLKQQLKDSEKSKEALKTSLAELRNTGQVPTENKNVQTAVADCNKDETQNLKEQITTLEEDLQTSKDEYNTLLQKISLVEMESKNLMEELKQEKSIKGELNESKIALECEKDNLTAKIKKYDDGSFKSNNLRMSLLEQEIEQMAEKHKKLQEEYNFLNEYIKQLQQRSENEYPELQTTQSFIETYEKKLTCLKDEHRVDENMQQSGNSSELINSLRQEIDQLKQQLNKNSEDDGIGFAADLDQELIESLQEKILKYEQQLDERGSEISKLEKEISSLQNGQVNHESVDTKDDSNNDLRNNLQAQIEKMKQDIQQKCDEVNNINNALTSKEEEFKHKIAEYEQELLNSRAAVSKQAETIDSLRQQLTIVTEEMDLIQNSNNQKLEESLKQLKDSLCDKDNQILNLQHQKENLSEKLDTVTSTLSLCESTLSGLKLEFANLQEKCQKDAREQAHLFNENENFKIHITKLQAQKQELDEELRQTISALNQAENKISDETGKESTKINIEVFQKNIAQLERELDKCKDEVNFYKLQNDDFDKIIISKKSEIEKLEIKCKHLEQELSSVRDNLKEKEDLLAKIQKSSHHKEAASTEIQNELTSKQNEIVELKKELETQREKAQSSETDLNNLYAMIQEKAADMEEIARNRELLDKEVESLNLKNEELTNKLTELTDENAIMNETNKQCNSKISSLEEKLSELKSAMPLPSDIDALKLSYEEKFETEKKHSEELAASYDSLMKELCAVVAEKDAATELSKTSLEKYNKEKKFFESEVENLNMKYNDLKDKSEAMKRKLDNKDSEIVALKKAVEISEQDAVVSSTVDDLNVEIIEKNKHINSLKQEVYSLKEKLEVTLRSANEQHEDLVRKHIEEMKELENSSTKLKIELEKIKDEYGTAQSDLEDAKSVGDAKQEKLIQECKNLKQVNNMLKIKCSDFEMETKQWEEKGSQLKNVEEQLLQIQDHYNTLKIEHNGCLKLEQQLKQEVSSLKQNLSDQQKLMSLHQNDNSVKYQSVIAKQESEIKLLKQEMLKRDSRQEELDKKLDEAIINSKMDSSKNSMDGFLMLKMKENLESMNKECFLLQNIQTESCLLERSKKLLVMYREKFHSMLKYYEQRKQDVISKHPLLIKRVCLLKNDFKRLQDISGMHATEASKQIKKAADIQEFYHGLEFNQIQEGNTYNGIYRTKFKSFCYELYEEHKALLEQFSNEQTALEQRLHKNMVKGRPEELEQKLADETRKFAVFYMLRTRQIKQLAVELEEKIVAKLDQILHSTLTDDKENTATPTNEREAKLYIQQMQQRIKEATAQHDHDIQHKIVTHKEDVNTIPKMNHQALFLRHERRFDEIEQKWKQTYEMIFKQITMTGNDNTEPTDSRSLQQVKKEAKRQILELEVALNSEKNKYKELESLFKGTTQSTKDDIDVELLRDQLSRYKLNVQELKAELSSIKQINQQLREQMKSVKNGHCDSEPQIKVGSCQKSAVEELFMSESLEKEKRERMQHMSFLEKELAKYKDVENKRKVENAELLEENNKLRNYLKKMKQTRTDSTNSNGNVLQENTNIVKLLDEVSPPTASTASDEPNQCKNQ